MLAVALGAEPEPETEKSARDAVRDAARRARGTSARAPARGASLELAFQVPSAARRPVAACAWQAASCQTGKTNQAEKLCCGEGGKGVQSIAVAAAAGDSSGVSVRAQCDLLGFRSRHRPPTVLRSTQAAPAPPASQAFQRL